MYKQNVFRSILTSGLLLAVALYPSWIFAGPAVILTGEVADSEAASEVMTNMAVDVFSAGGTKPPVIMGASKNSKVGRARPTVVKPDSAAITNALRGASTGEGTSTMLVIANSGGTRSTHGAGVRLADGQELTVEGLGAMLPEAGSKSTRILSLGPNGDLHSLAEKREKTCAVTTAAGAETLKVKGTVSLYGQAVLRELKSPEGNLRPDGKVNLYQAHLAGAGADYLNSGLNQISSMAFVEKTLKRRSAKKNKEGNDAFKGESGHWEFNIDDPKTLQKLRLAARAGYNSPIEPCSIKSLEQTSTMASQLTKLMAFKSPGGSQETANLPPEVVELRTQLLQEWKELSKDLAFFNSVREYEELKEWYKGLDGTKRVNEQPKYEEKKKQLKGAIDNKGGKVWSMFRRTVELERMELFMRVASDEEKEKFKSLLACEWEPL